MKVIFFSSYYSNYLDSFYKKNIGLSLLSYNEQMSALQNDFFGDWASYLPRFSKLGIESHLIIPNCKPLQQAWAKENNVQFDQKHWMYSLPLEQTKRIRPDVFYISSMFEYYGDFLDNVRPYVKKIFSWIACDIPHDVNLLKLDLILSSLPLYVKHFRNEGLHSEFLHAAFDSTILERLDKNVRNDIDFSFIGNLTKFHGNRIKLVKELINKTDLLFFGTGVDLIPDDRNLFKRIVTKSIYKQRTKEPVWGLDMYRTLQRSKITFNAHIDISNQFIGNMRMYEATGMGTLLLTDGKNAPQKNFNDDEVIYYDTINDAIEKVNYYLQHEHERAAVATKGQQRTLTEHNYENSSRKLLDFFNQYLNTN